MREREKERERWVAVMEGGETRKRTAQSEFFFKEKVLSADSELSFPLLNSACLCTETIDLCSINVTCPRFNSSGVNHKLSCQ